MKKLPLAITLLFAMLHIGLNAQVFVSPKIQDELAKSDWVKINIRLDQSYNLDSLHTLFETNKTPASSRASLTINELKKHATASQEELALFLKNNPEAATNIKQYWIVNMITAHIHGSLLEQLVEIPAIAELRTDEYRYKLHEPLPGTITSQKALHAENGLYAINAPALWKMGYTGRNRKALGVDTGVKHKHPAIADRFLGKYKPLEHAWYGFNNPSPEDLSFSSYHGTHTIGTVLGLDPNTNDTIGVAWNAYWMASDPIVSDIKDVRTLDAVLQSFEWALNPDGDFNTVSDMPDVITNSWGYDGFYDFADCNPPEAEAIFAATTAGIGVIFSAGNDGPDSTTIGQPANLAPTLLSVFSVGAVDGNKTTLPIASFSSRGPTSCINKEDDFSRWIKPEVVAPGVNVRSAQNIDSYGALSGTSMAAPHVAGAFLLLKEAFPYLAGETILNALYESASDLGDQGEDNTYGKGIIDVKSAFDLLAQENTPLLPNSSNFDIAISAINGSEKGFSFSNEVGIEFSVLNKGANPVTDFNLILKIHNEKVLDKTITALINAGETKTFSVNEIPISEGKNRLTISIGIQGIEELDTINNTSYLVITKPKHITLPFDEFFDSTKFDFSNTLFTLINHDSDWTWTVDTAGGLSNSSFAMRCDFTKMKQRVDQLDEIISPLISIPSGNDSISLRFAYAYAKRAANLFKDSLLVLTSTNFGKNWNDTLFAEGGAALATIAKEVGSTRFVPTDSSQWKTLQLDLTKYKGTDLLVSFKTVNDNGSNLYLDNIQFFKGLHPASIESKKNETNQLLLFPNPSSDYINIKINEGSFKGRYALVNSLGQIQDQGLLEMDGHTKRIPVSMLPAGVYYVLIQNNQEVFTKAFVKK